VVHWRQNIDALQAKLADLEAQPDQPLPIVKEILANQLPKLQKDLEQWALSRTLPPSPQPEIPPDALKSWSAAMAFTKQIGDLTPEADWRLTHATSEGLPTFEHRTPKRVPDAIRAGERSFANIPVPVLAIYRAPKTRIETDPALQPARDARYAIDTAATERYRQNFLNAAPQGQVVLIPGADHNIHLSNPDDVIRAMKAFTAGLPK
jgi:pimeloyl-ACP methyl ester carboxylesterase